jgi:membrane-bound serine protease (ClpP class)
MRILELVLLVSTITGTGLAAQVQVRPVVYRIPVTGTVEHGLAPFVDRALREARAAGAVAAVLDMDTPGGRVDAAERIVRSVQQAGLPVFAFVNTHAYSAGAMIALAAQAIYMAPAAVLGAATPVDGQGTKAPEKIVSAMRAQFRALAEQRGVDPRLAEGMVDETIEIPGIKPAGQLLTFTTAEAIQHGFARAEARTLEDLLIQEGVETPQVVTPSPNWAEQVVRFLTHPLVSPLLLSLGMLGLLFEIKSGAFGVGGLVSLAALGLFFGSHLLVGLAGWEEVLLLGLGLIALGVEVFVLPGFGVAGVLGIVLIVGSMLLALVGSLPTLADFVQAGAIIAVALVVTVAVLFGWLRHLPSSTRWSGLFLRDATAAAEGYISAPPRRELVGQRGVAITDLRPSGVARIGGERLDVVTDGEFIQAGTAVAVVRSDGYRHVVQQVDEG